MGRNEERAAWETHLENVELSKARAKDHARRVPVKSAPGTKFDVFVELVKASGLPAPETEYEFARPRKFRADYCWPAAKVIVERNGGIFKGGAGGGTQKGGHSSALGILRDMEKSNLAQLAGYRFLQFTPRDLERGLPIPMLRILLDDAGSTT